MGFPHSKEIPYTKINSKRINNWNISIKSIKFLEEYIKLNLRDTGIKNGFLDMTPKTWAKKKKDKLDFIKIQIFCVSMDTKKS